MTTLSEATHYQQYELLRREDGSIWELGRGAMGVTYKAFDTNLRCTVALKVINAAHLDSDTAQQRFLREARAAAALRHPHVASVFNLGTDQDHCFYVMEFVDGETVETYVNRHGPLAPAKALRLSLQVTRALAAAAKKRLVHRDLKPANLMLVDQDGEAVVKVIDFGLAKGIPGEGDDSTRLTVGGGFVGTPYYASPEQVEDAEVDTRSDLYSLGATLYFLLTGRPPFSGSAGQVMRQHLCKPIPMGPLAHLPGCVTALVQRLMEKDPAQRPQTAHEVQEALLGCLEQICGPTAALELASAPKGPLSPGVLLAQSYRLVEEVGDSPQGRQFLAQDLRRQRPVSLLALSREFVSDAPRLTALKEAVDRVRAVPHPQLREVYGLETAAGSSFLVEEHVGGPSLLELLRCRGALSAPEVVRLVSLLAPPADHARVHRLEHVDLTLQGVYLTDPGAGGTQSALLRQPLTRWQRLEPKVNAIDFSVSCAKAGNCEGEVTRVGDSPEGGPRGSYMRLLGLLAYEALGGPRARVESKGRYVPVAALGEGGNAVLRRALAEDWPSAGELAQQLAASVSSQGLATPASGRRAPSAAREAPPKAAAAAPSPKRPLPPRALPVVLAGAAIIAVSMGGYALRRARHPQKALLRTIEPQAKLTPSPAPSPPAPLPAVLAPPAPSVAPTPSATPTPDAAAPSANLTPQPSANANGHGQAPRAPASPSPIQDPAPAPTPSATPVLSVVLPAGSSPPPPAAPSPTPSPADGLAEAERYLKVNDYAKALPLLQMAANAGNAEAMYHLGVMYANGRGVPQDDNKAREWYQKAAGLEDQEVNPSPTSIPDAPQIMTKPGAPRGSTRRRPYHHHAKPTPTPKPPFWKWFFREKETKKAQSAPRRH